MQKEIPFIDLVSNYKKFRKEILASLDDVFLSGKYILGNYVVEFEKKIAEFLGSPYAIGVNSGTDALRIALRALGIKKNDEVITTPFTFVSTAEVIADIGAKPVFADINPKTFNIDNSEIIKKITSKTKAIIAVHLFGLPCEIEELSILCKEKGIHLIEDVAQSFGAMYNNKYVGTFGDIGCFSFYPTKNLFTYGDGGLIITNDDLINKKCRMLRNHGIDKNYDSEFLGYNSRLDTIHAAIMLRFLPFISKWNQRRRYLAKLYIENLKNLQYIECPYSNEKSYHVYNQFTIRVKNKKRDLLQNYLADKKISTFIYYPKPLHLMKAFSFLGYKEKDFPNAEAASKEVLSLPLWHNMPKKIVSEVCDAIKNWEHHYA